MWRFSKELHQLSGLSLAAALSVIQALLDYHPIPSLGVKWPNDVLAKGRKLAGVLIECGKEEGAPTSAPPSQSVVIGVGLNVMMHRALGNKIAQPWVDVAELLGEIPDRNRLAGLLLNHLINTLIQFEREGFKPFLGPWLNWDLTFKKPVRVKTPKICLQGKGAGIDETGGFLLEIPQGQILRFLSGEVSLRLAEPALSPLE